MSDMKTRNSRPWIYWLIVAGTLVVLVWMTQAWISSTTRAVVNAPLEIVKSFFGGAKAVVAGALRELGPKTTETFRTYILQTRKEAFLELTRTAALVKVQRVEESLNGWAAHAEVEVEAPYIVPMGLDVGQAQAWEVTLKGNTLTVRTPALKAGLPALQVEHKVRRITNSSPWLDEERMLNDAEQELPGKINEQMPQLLSTARANARESLHDIIRNWAKQYPDGQDLNIEITFGDEKK
jgi:hypothetical protein